MDDQEEPPDNNGDGAKHWISLTVSVLGLIEILLPYWVGDSASPVTGATELALWYLHAIGA
ncbi:hypothetical protein ACQP2U_43965 (plasmid) [Nocardia sp. CA-084685]|uniref:hypothetical protein n=1 Tax=unclassified Nocardia TaxID=2637762 RepID=UPI00343390F4